MKAQSINKVLKRGDYYDVDTDCYVVPSKIVNIYNAPFNIDNLYKLFSGWTQQQVQEEEKEENDDYVFVDQQGQNMISFDENEMFFNLRNPNGEEYSFDAFPERINSFLNYCEVAGIEIHWKKWVTEKYF